MTLRQKVLGIGGATLIAVSAVLGAQHFQTPAPAPIAVAHGICESGKTVSKVVVDGKTYKIGSACTAIPDPVKPKAPAKKHR